MSKVCQCDSCGAVAPYKQCLCVHIHTFDAHGSENASKYIREICPACFTKLSAVLNIYLGGKKNDG